MDKTIINSSARQIVDICRNGLIPCSTSSNAMPMQIEEHFTKLKLLVDVIGKEVSGVQVKGSKAEVLKVKEDSKAEVVKVKSSRQRTGKKQENQTRPAA